MKKTLWLLLPLLSLCGFLFAADSTTDINFNKAREIHRRQQNGETLSTEDQAYLRKAMEMHRRQNQPSLSADGIDWPRARALLQREQKGEALSPEDRAYLNKVKAIHARGGQGTAGADGPAKGGKDSTGLIALSELGDEKYKGETGGLYGEGKNEPPPEHAAATKRELAKICPLDANGAPSDQGKVVLVSIGMSNTTMEFSRFKQLADADPDKSPKLVIVDCAQGGQTAARWAAGPDAQVWKQAVERIEAAGVTTQQVQVAWIKQANAHPTEAFPAHAKSLQEDLTKDLHLLKAKFPNLRVAYLSSRIYGGYATTELNPEPYAYETGFAVRWLIQSQIQGAPELNYDAARGAVKSPLLLWGPYLWADGLKARTKDGVTWTRDDLVARDGTHPSTAGRQKVAKMLLEFFKSDPSAKGWFLARP